MPRPCAELLTIYSQTVSEKKNTQQKQSSHFGNSRWNSTAEKNKNVLENRGFRKKVNKGEVRKEKTKLRLKQSDNF